MLANFGNKAMSRDDRQGNGAEPNLQVAACPELAETRTAAWSRLQRPAIASPVDASKKARPGAAGRQRLVDAEHGEIDLFRRQ